MKKRDLELHLRFNGCVLLRQGARHEIWLNPASGLTSSVPRHNEVKTHTARSICTDLGIPHPAGR